MFEHILNWKLLEGSHEFPGPDGGTCINEAAIVAAGFDYKQVHGVEDLPYCFCPFLGTVLIFLNDNLRDENRQKLMKYVTKLAGSRDNEKLNARYELIAAFVLDNYARLYRLNSLRLGDSFRKIFYDKDRFTFYFELSTTVEQWGGIAVALHNLLCIYKVTTIEAVLNLLDQAFAIGNQAKPIETTLVIERMEKIRALA